jgi:hypothetical protein
MEASKRSPKDETYNWAAKILGVDVARYGDDSTVIVLRQGCAMFRPRVLRDLNTMEVAGHVAELHERHDVDAIFVDVGGVGAGVYDWLRAHGYPVRAVDFGGKPTNPRFLNKRCEMWWEMADWVKTMGAIPNDKNLIRDLCAPKFDYKRADGKLKLESKDDLRERGLPSPDLADALALTFAFPVLANERPVVPPFTRSPRRGMALHDQHPFAEL